DPTGKETDHQLTRNEISRDQHYRIRIRKQLAPVRIIPPTIEAARFLDVNDFDQIAIPHRIDGIRLISRREFSVCMIAYRHFRTPGVTRLVSILKIPIATRRYYFCFMLRLILEPKSPNDNFISASEGRT